MSTEQKIVENDFTLHRGGSVVVKSLPTDAEVLGTLPGVY